MPYFARCVGAGSLPRYQGHIRRFNEMYFLTAEIKTGFHEPAAYFCYSCTVSGSDFRKRSEFIFVAFFQNNQCSFGESLSAKTKFLFGKTHFDSLLHQRCQ